jgi:serine/threonine-protein kinase
MGVVFRATQLALGRPVALKLIATAYAADGAFRARFKRERETAAAIDHPNVIPLYEAGEAEDHLFIAMRWVAGRDLSYLLHVERRLAADRAVGIVAQVAAALDAAHARGLVHRDVKPANVLIEGDGDGQHCVLTDFGLMKNVRATSAPLTVAGSFLGTCDYAAPEQLQGGRIDARVDVYALGCMLYQAVTGQVPFPRPVSAATMMAHMDDPRPAVSAAAPDAPAALDDVVRTAMAKDPDERYPSAGELGRAALRATR